MGARVVTVARGEIGKHPYVFGAKTFTPDGPLDCSGFSQYVYQQISREIGPGTWFQRDYCKRHGMRVVPPYQAGDILFFMDEGPVTPSHVGICSDDNTVLEETATFGNVVEVAVAPRWDQWFVEGWRIL